MIDTILQIIAPHHCYSCGLTGALLCTNCKYDIVSDPFEGCIVCAKPAIHGVCPTCSIHYNKAWCVGERSGSLERLLDGYKFERAKSAVKITGELLGNVVPLLPSTTVIVPMPTIASHVRIRGYDHALLMSRHFARFRGLRVQTVLKRASVTVQRGANRKQRFEQAKTAYAYTAQLTADRPYLLIDDIVTTGASLEYAAKALRDAGAKDVWVAVIARQPLDK